MDIRVVFQFIVLCLLVNSFLGQYNLTGSSDYAISGSPFTFTCHTGHSVMGIEWNIDDFSFTAIQGQGTNCSVSNAGPTDYVYSCNESIYTLKITSVSFSQRGTVWKCAGVFGGSESRRLRLDVHVQVTTTSLQNITSQNEMIHVGTSEDPFTLICVTSPSNPAPAVSWYMNGREIDSDVTNTAEKTPEHLIVTTSSLSLPLSRSHDGHSLYCRAWIAGQTPVTSNSGILDVWYAPRVKILSNNHTRIELGKLLILRCSTQSDMDNFTFDWTLGQKYLVDGPVLQIAAFHESDQGEYTCSATIVSTRRGSLTGSANVIVTVLKSAPVACYCTAHSTSSVNLIWEYDRTDMSNGFTIVKRLFKKTHWIPLPMFDVQRDGKLYSLHISDLESNSGYYFKIFSSTNKDESNFCLTTCRTSISTDVLGLGAGIAIGVVVGVTVTSVASLIVYVVLVRRRCPTPSDAKRQTETNVYEDASMESEQHVTSTEINESTNTYEMLQSNEATSYEHLNMYSNGPQSGNT